MTVGARQVCRLAGAVLLTSLLGAPACGAPWSARPGPLAEDDWPPQAPPVASPCPPGKTRTLDTGSRCCWPGQVWSKLQLRCVGLPRCPGWLEAGGEGCCPRGRITSLDTGDHCCWPGQAWSRLERRCVGLPSCPEGFVADGERCLVEPEEMVAEAETALEPDEVADEEDLPLSTDDPDPAGPEPEPADPFELWELTHTRLTPAPEALAEARVRVIEGDQAGCIRALRAAQRTGPVVRLLVSCYEAAGRRAEACALARRHAHRVRMARQFWEARCAGSGGQASRRPRETDALWSLDGWDEDEEAEGGWDEGGW